MTDISFILLQSQTRVKELIAELELLQSMNATLTTDCDYLRNSLKVSSELSSTLQHQNSTLKAELENVTAQLNLELNQNQVNCNYTLTFLVDAVVLPICVGAQKEAARICGERE